MKPVQVTTFVGIDNVDAIWDVADNALTDAVNVNLTNAGSILRRHGYAKAKDLAVTTAFSTKYLSAYVVSGGVLYRVEPELSLTALSPSTASHFCDAGKYLYTNDGLRVSETSVLKLTVPSPDFALTLRQASGDWPGGTYSATYTFTDLTTGLEGGSAPIASLTIPDNAAVSFEPVVPPAGHSVTYYMTEVDGGVYYAPNGVKMDPVRELSAPFPAGTTHVAFFEGRVYAALPMSNGQTLLRFSTAFYNHLFDYVRDYVIIPGELRDMMVAPQGIVIATDSAIYLLTDQLTTLADYGVPRGRSLVRAPDDSVYIHSKRGVCHAMPFENLTERKALFPVGEQVSATLVQRDGISAVVTLSDGSGQAYNIRNY